MEYLGEFALDFSYRPGKDSPVPDALSRLAPAVGAAPQRNSHSVPVPSSAAPVALLQDELKKFQGTGPQNFLQGASPEHQEMLSLAGQQAPGAKLSNENPANLQSIIVDPSWLARLSRAQQNAQDAAMAKLVARARSPDRSFCLKGEAEKLLLYHVDKSGREQLVLPESGGFREMALTELHDSSLSGHLGVRKTIAALLQRFWWPNLTASVRSYIRSCPVCQRCKDRTTAKPGLLQPLPYPESRFSEYSLDFIFGLPTCYGFSGILTVVDRATKRVVLRPCSANVSADATAALLFDGVVRVYGVPTVLLSDRDPRFISQVWQSLMTRLGTRLVYSSAYHPQTDGQTERAHRVIEQVLRAYVIEHAAADWVDFLGPCEFALNNAVQVSTGQTPNALTFGQELRTPVDLACGRDPGVSLGDLGNRLLALCSAARDCVARAQAY